jgi:uncharacterized protein
MTTLTLIRPNLHRVDSAGRQLLFHVPSSSLFELDGACARRAGAVRRARHAR